MTNFNIPIPEIGPHPFQDTNTPLEYAATETNIALWAIAERLQTIALALNNPASPAAWAGRCTD